MSRAEELRRALERAILVVGSAGCCAPVFARPVDGVYDFAYRQIAPAALASATVDARGFFDRETCSAVCDGDSVCYPAHFAPAEGVPPPEETFVACGHHFAGHCSTSDGPLGSGRVPRGMLAPRAPAGQGIGAWAARAACFEEASVFAFERMARELAAFGAPRALVRGAERAAREERRHAEIMGRLAARRAVTAERAKVRRLGRRSFAAFARENALEGCIEETVGAFVALARGESASAADDDVREAMRTIGREELGHAALSWRVWDFCRPRLAPRARARIEREMERRCRTLCANRVAPR